MQKILIAGVDEAGRGPLAGAVVAGAVILDDTQPIAGLADSKKLSEKRREQLFDEIHAKALAVGVGLATAEEIDAINILQASLVAMQRAVAALTIVPTQILVDGNKCPEFTQPARAIIQGDCVESCISAGSIIAKVTRDRLMYALDKEYPAYGFAQHKGYPTKAHMLALQQHGPCAIHRRSFRPVQQAMQQEA